MGEMTAKDHFEAARGYLILAKDHLLKMLASGVEDEVDYRHLVILKYIANITKAINGRDD